MREADDFMLVKYGLKKIVLFLRYKGVIKWRSLV